MNTLQLANLRLILFSLELGPKILGPPTAFVKDPNYTCISDCQQNPLTTFSNSLVYVQGSEVISLSVCFSLPSCTELVVRCLQWESRR